jgi:hypothetical protein
MTPSPAPTCGPLYQDALRTFAGDDPERMRLFAAGFMSGQAEKVYLGACQAAMFRPSAERREMALEILADLARRYGLAVVTTAVAGELWLCRPASVADIELLALILPDSPGWHIWRGLLCGVPPDEIDVQFHERPGHGQRCD